MELKPPTFQRKSTAQLSCGITSTASRSIWSRSSATVSPTGFSRTISAPASITSRTSADHIVGGAGHRNRLDARHLAVDAVQSGEHPFARAAGVVVDHQVDPFADGEARRVLALLLEFAVHCLHGFGEARGRRRARAEERVTRAAPRGPVPQERWRRTRLADGAAAPAWAGSEPVDVAEAAVKRHCRLVGPRRLHQLQPLGEAADERRPVHSERRELAEAATWRDPEIQPAVAELVDGGARSRQLKRIMQRRDQHAHPQPQPGSARGAYARSSSGASDGACPMVCSSVQPPSKPSSSARSR